MNYLPSTQSLRCFLAVANHGGIRSASAELFITQSAVSHQISQLEKQLGIALFRKQGRNIELTGAGQDYLRHIESVMQQLERATIQASQFRESRQLSISAPPTFIENWLLPNLGEFEQEYGEMSIRLSQQLSYDKSDTSIDIAVEYRFHPNPAFESLALIDDGLCVLASPEYIAKHRIQSLDDLRNARLIETQRRLTAWIDVLWDQPWVHQHPFLSVPHSSQAFAAARLGYGVAIGNRFNARKLLDEGHLLIPFELPQDRQPEVPRYFLTTPHAKSTFEPVKLFKSWLLNRAN